MEADAETLFDIVCPTERDRLRFAKLVAQAPELLDAVPFDPAACAETLVRLREAESAELIQLHDMLVQLDERETVAQDPLEQCERWFAERRLDLALKRLGTKNAGEAELLAACAVAADCLQTHEPPLVTSQLNEEYRQQLRRLNNNLPEYVWTQMQLGWGDLPKKLGTQLVVSLIWAYAENRVTSVAQNLLLFVFLVWITACGDWLPSLPSDISKYRWRTADLTTRLSRFPSHASWGMITYAAVACVGSIALNNQLASWTMSSGWQTHATSDRAFAWDITEDSRHLIGPLNALIAIGDLQSPERISHLYMSGPLATNQKTWNVTLIALDALLIAVAASYQEAAADVWYSNKLLASAVGLFFNHPILASTVGYGLTYFRRVAGS